MNEEQLIRPNVEEQIRLMKWICYYNGWDFDIITAKINDRFDTLIKINVKGVNCFRWNYSSNDEKASMELCAENAMKKIFDYALLHMRESSVKFLKANNKWNGDHS